VPGNGEVDLTFLVEEPSSPLEVGWSTDDRRLGLRPRAIAVAEVDRSLRPGEKIVFSEGSGAERFLGEGWSRPEPTGVWTDGERARLVLKLTEAPPADAELVVAASAFLTPVHRELEVEVSAFGKQLVRRVFRYGDALRLIQVAFPADAHGGRAPFELRLSDPARPVDLGAGEDARQLGLRLEWLIVRKHTWRASLSDAALEKSTNLRSRFRPSS
jgi:hypothetical protein